MSATWNLDAPQRDSGQDAKAWLIGGGQMGAAIRAYEWGRTTLGPIESWPQSLRIAVSVCLNSRFPMFIWWGPELVNLYNDPYIPVLGRRHPDALGRQAPELWPEVWPVIAGQVDAVLQRGEASWQERMHMVVRRNDYDEDAWFTYSHSPILDEAGAIRGLLCVLVEETGSVRAERRQTFLLELADRLRTLSDPREIMDSAIEALGHNLRASRVGYGHVQPDGVNIALESSYVDGVAPLLGVFPLDGFGAENIARQRQGVTVVHDDVNADAANNPDTWSAVHTRAFVSVPLVRDGQFRASLFVNQREPRRWSREEVSLIEEVAARTWDAVQRVQAERALRESESRLKAVLDSVPVGIVLAEVPSGRIVLGNRQIERILRHPVMHSEGVEQYNEWPLLDAEGQPVPAEQYPITRALRTGEPAWGEYLYRRGDGALGWIDVSSAPVRDRSGQVTGAVVAVADIDERKHTEEARRTAEERLSFALQAAGGIGAWDWSVPDDVIYADAHFAELFSVEPERAAAGVSLNDFVSGIHPDDRAAVQEQIERVLQNGEEFASEYRVCPPDGSVRWLHARGRCHRDESGRPVRFPGVVLEITERKRSEMALRESESRFRHLADHAPVMVWVTERDGTCTYLSRSWHEFTGQTEEEALGFGWLEATHPDDRPEVERTFLEANRTRVPFRVEYRLRRKDGVYRWMFDTAAPRVSDDGVFLGYVGSVLDITERREAEQALKESEAGFRELANAVPAFVWATDPEGNLTFFNQRWYVYTGLTPEESLGSGWVSTVLPEDVSRVLAAWQEARTLEKPYSVEMRYRNANGEARWFMARALPVRDANGQIVHWFGTSTDVHEAKLALEALHKAKRELEEFAYVASHDLQEPLRMVSIYTEKLLRGFVPDQPSAREYAGYISQGVKRMHRLIQDLLSFSRIIHADEQIGSGTADLSESLAIARAVLGDRITETGATITAGALPAVRGDVQQLAQVFQNLLSNSLKYRHPERTPEIRIWAERRETDWIISFEDNGIGFAQPYAERIFGLFKRLHKEEFEGTGLGLAICHRIVERYGGRIWAEGRPGQGATFRFVLSAPDVQ